MPTDPTRPRRSLLPLAVACLAALLLAGAATLWVATNRAPPPAAAAAGGGVGGPFTLTNGDGKPVTDRDFRGKFMLVYFGYTFCPDVCPTTLSDVTGALEKMGAAADRVQPVFISVDPARDTPEVVRQYVSAFTPRLQGLTGTPDQIAAVAKAYHVYYATHDARPGATDYTVDHSSILYVMGPDGQFIGVIRADSGPEAIARDLTELIA